PPAFKSGDIFLSVMSFMDKTSGSIPGAGIHVLITAPGSKIHIPLVQFQFNITRCMGKVPTDESTYSFTSLCNGCNIENLPSIIIHAADQDQRTFFSNLLYFCQNILCSEIVFPFPLLKLYDGFSGI